MGPPPMPVEAESSEGERGGKGRTGGERDQRGQGLRGGGGWGGGEARTSERVLAEEREALHGGGCVHFLLAEEAGKKKNEANEGAQKDAKIKR